MFERARAMILSLSITHLEGLRPRARVFCTEVQGFGFVARNIQLRAQRYQGRCLRSRELVIDTDLQCILET